MDCMTADPPSPQQGPSHPPTQLPTSSSFRDIAALGASAPSLLGKGDSPAVPLGIPRMREYDTAVLSLRAHRPTLP